MNQRDWERYEDSYEKPRRTKKKKTWKEINQEKRNKKPKWNKKKGVKNEILFGKQIRRNCNQGRFER